MDQYSWCQPQLKEAVIAWLRASLAPRHIEVNCYNDLKDGHILFKLFQYIQEIGTGTVSSKRSIPSRPVSRFAKIGSYIQGQSNSIKGAVRIGSIYGINVGAILNYRDEQELCKTAVLLLFLGAMQSESPILMAGTSLDSEHQLALQEILKIIQNKPEPAICADSPGVTTSNDTTPPGASAASVNPRLSRLSSNAVDSPLFAALMESPFTSSKKQSLYSQLRKVKLQVMSLEEERDMLKEDKESQREEMSKEINALKEQLMNLQAMISDCYSSEEYTAVEELAQSLKSANSMLETKIVDYDEMRDRMTWLDNVVEKDSTTIQTLQQQNTSLSNHLEEVSSLSTGYKSQLDSLSVELTSTQEELSNVKQYLALKEEEIISLQDIVNSLNSKPETPSFCTEENLGDVLLMESQKEVTALQESLEAEIEKHHSAIEELSSFKMRNIELVASAEKLNATNEENIGKLETLLTEKSQTIELGEVKCAELQRLVEQLKDEKVLIEDRLHESVTSLQHKLSTELGEKQSLHESYTHSVSQLESLRGQYEVFRDQSEKQITEMETDYRQLDQDRNQLQEKLAAEMDAIKTLQSLLEKERCEAAQNMDIIKENASQRQKELMDGLESTAKQLQNSNCKLQEKEKQISDLTSELHKSNLKIEQLSGDMTRFVGEISKLQNDIECNDAKWSRENNGLKSQILALEEANGKRSEQLSEQETLLSDKSNAIATLEVKCVDLEMHIEKLHSEAHSLEAQLDSLKLANLNLNESAEKTKEANQENISRLKALLNEKSEATKLAEVKCSELLQLVDQLKSEKLVCEDRLNEDLDRLKQELSKAFDEKTLLRESYSQSLLQLELLQAQHEEFRDQSENQVSESESFRRQLDQDRTELEEKLATEMDTIKTLQSLLEKQKCEAARDKEIIEENASKCQKELMEDLESTTKLLQSSNTKMQEKEKQISDLTSDLLKSSLNIKQMSEDITKFTDEITKLKFDAEYNDAQWSREKNQLDSRILVLEEANGKQSEQLSEQESLLSERSNVIAILETKCNDFEKHIGKLDNETCSLKTQLETLKLANLEINESAEKMEKVSAENISKLEALLAGKSQAIDLATIEYTGLQQHIDQLKNEHITLEGCLKKNITDLQQELSNALDENNSLQDSYAQSQLQLKSLHTQYDELCSQTKNQISVLETDVTQLSYEKSNLKEELAMKVDSDKLLRETLEREKCEAEQNIKILEENASKCQEQITKELESIVKKLESSNCKVQESEMQISDLTGNLATAHCEIEEKSNEISKLMHEVCELKEYAERNNTQWSLIKEKLDKQILSLEGLNGNLEQQVSSQESSISEKCNTIKVIEGKCADLEKLTERLSHENDAVQTQSKLEIENVRTKLEEVIKEKEALYQSNSSLMKQRDALELECKEAKRQHSSLEDAEHKLAIEKDALSKELSSEISLKKLLQESLEKEQLAAAKNIKVFQDDATKCQQEMMKKIKSANVNLENNTKKLQEHQNEIAELSAALAEAQLQLRNKCDDEIKQSELFAEKESVLQSKLGSVTSELHQTQASLETVVNKLESLKEEYLITEKDLHNIIEKQQRDYADIKMSLESESSKVNTLQESLRELGNTNLLLQDQNRDLSIANRSALESGDIKDSEKKALELRLKEARNELHNHKLQAAGKEASLLAKIHEQQLQIQKAEELLWSAELQYEENIAEMNERHQHQVENLSNVAETQIGSATNLQAQCSVFEGEIRQLAECNIKLEHQLKSANDQLSEKTNLETKLKDSEETGASLKQQYAELVADMASLSEKLSKAEEDISVKVWAIETLEFDLTEVKEKYKQQDQELTEVKEKYKQQDRELAEVKEKYKQQDQELMGSKSQLEQLQQNITEHQLSVSEMEKEKSSLINNAKALNDELSSLKQELVNADETSQYLERYKIAYKEKKRIIEDQKHELKLINAQSNKYKNDADLYKEKYELLKAEIKASEELLKSQQAVDLATADESAMRVEELESTIIEDINVNRRRSHAVNPRRSLMPNPAAVQTYGDDEADVLIDSTLKPGEGGSSVFTEAAAAAGLLREPVPKEEDANERIAELMRRNSRNLPHMRSAYPIESQTYTPSKAKSDDIRESRMEELEPSMSLRAAKRNSISQFLSKMKSGKSVKETIRGGASTSHEPRPKRASHVSQAKVPSSPVKRVLNSSENVEHAASTSATARQRGAEAFLIPNTPKQKKSMGAKLKGAFSGSKR